MHESQTFLDATYRCRHQARESGVLGNGHAPFGEGRQDEGWEQYLAGRLLHFVHPRSYDALSPVYVAR
jgi:hypothetical protein